MFDVLGGLGCSVLIVGPEQSQTKGPLFGRNLDFPTLGYLQEYSLVTIFHPAGKKPFVAVTFPGCIGVLSGMNRAGLALAVLEVYESKDQSMPFDSRGTPYAMCFRKILEDMWDGGRSRGIPASHAAHPPVEPGGLRFTNRGPSLKSRPRRSPCAP